MHLFFFVFFSLSLLIKGKATISNDGATIVKLLDVVHPAAKMLVDIAKSQDAEVWMEVTSTFQFPFCLKPVLVVCVTNY